MIVRPYRGVYPRIGERVFIAETAAVIGDAVLGDDVSIWYSSVVRGDCCSIRIGARSNVQDNCTIHTTVDVWPTIIGEEVTIGHGAIVHGCTVHRGALIGMGSRVLDGAVIGEGALVGAGAVVPEGMHVPAGMLVLGVPARIKRALNAEEIARADGGWKHYVEYKNRYLGS